MYPVSRLPLRPGWLGRCCRIPTFICGSIFDAYVVGDPLTLVLVVCEALFVSSAVAEVVEKEADEEEVVLSPVVDVFSVLMFSTMIVAWGVVSVSALVDAVSIGAVADAVAGNELIVDLRTSAVVEAASPCVSVLVVP